jgi:hypothetical protein
MAIILDFSVSNIKNTPGMYSSTFATRPPADQFGEGTIFIATDTGAMYQTDGSTWYSIGGGSGSTPGIDSVLAVGQLFTDDRTINGDGFSLLFENFAQLDFRSSNNTQFLIQDNLIYSSYGGDIRGFQLDFGDSIYRIGDFLNNFKGTFIEIDDNSNLIQTYGANGQTFGLKVSALNQVFLGDFDGQSNGLLIYVDDTNSLMHTAYNSSNIGFYFDYANGQYYFGQPGGIIPNLSYIRVGTDDICLINANTRVHTFTNSIYYSGSLTSGSSGGNSGQHLQININGTNYKIALLNP